MKVIAASPLIPTTGGCWVMASRTAGDFLASTGARIQSSR